MIEIEGHAGDLGGNDVYCRGACSSTRVCIVSGKVRSVVELNMDAP